jgi:hypothetical protein
MLKDISWLAIQSPDALVSGARQNLDVLTIIAIFGTGI